MEYVGKCESKEYPGFYYVPTLPHVLINIDGLVIDTIKQWCPLPDINPDGYLCVNAENNRRFIHRLLALTFLPEPEKSVTELDVNHIDGVKKNNSIENLEWASRSENCFHAYRTGLRSDNTPILVKDLRDGSVVRHYSLWECARNFNVDGSQIHNELQPFNYGKVYKNYYILIREGDTWPSTGPDAIGKHRNGVAKTVMGRNLNTDEVKVFSSVTNAGKFFNETAWAITTHIRKCGQRPFKGWSLKYAGFLDILDAENNQLTEKSYSPVMVS